jgi:hypothetical protein
MNYRWIKTEELENLKKKSEVLSLEVKNASKIIDDISNNNFTIQYSYEVESLALSKSILTMRDALAQVRNKEKEQMWLNEGMAGFSEILRKHNNTIKAVSDSIISYLVKFLNANQGFVFIYQKNTCLLELTASYAYNRKKLIEKSLMPGEGLVGQCFLEKQTNILTHLPNDYCSITSGLGFATPNCLAIVPIIQNEEVLGVFELATFDEFKPNQIDFLNKISKELAIALGNIMITEQTQDMLLQSEKLTKTLKEQEESLRQNYEELQATQEELLRKEHVNQLTILELNQKHQQTLKEVIAREEQLKETKKELLLKLTSNNTLIDVAGRQRMLSQKIGFYAEMVVRGNNSALVGLESAILMHEKTLDVIKSGGVPPGLAAQETLMPASIELIPAINKVKSVWMPFKEQALKILNHGKGLKILLHNEMNEAITFIEQHGEEMLNINNALLLECSKYNKQRILEMYQ